MKNKILLFSSLMAASVLFVMACSKSEDVDSVAKATSVPYVAFSYLDPLYIYGEGNSTLYGDLPDVVGVVVDSVYGFEGGYGGKTGMDSLKIHKSDLSFGDTISAGGTSFSTYRYNKGNYRTSLGSSVVIAKANTNPGPTNLEGDYARTSNGYILHLTKLADGIFLLFNPGGAPTVADNPYLLYNFKSTANTDSLSFQNQTDLCGGGLQLVDPGAPLSLPSSDYSAQYPPKITSFSPITFSWKVLEFPAADPESINPGGALCNWGTGVRTFVKQ